MGHATEVIVDMDGSGNFTTIQSALDAQRAFSPEAVTIRVKPGIYREKVIVPSWLTHISLIGEDAESTIITWSDFLGKQEGMHTFNSYTILIAGDDFYAENITFVNTAGPVGQAVAVHIEADRVVFSHCRFLGDQDTVYAGKGGSRHFFFNCHIEGTTDFIFGPSTVVFQKCIIVSKINSYITAASTPEKMTFDFVFLDCILKAEEGVERVYLGRPWRDYAKTVFIRCDMGSHIRPEGWHNWGRPQAEKLVIYAEFGSSGPGASPGTRVSWSKQLGKRQARLYTVRTVLGGHDEWDPYVMI